MAEKTEAPRCFQALEVYAAALCLISSNFYPNSAYLLWHILFQCFCLKIYNLRTTFSWKCLYGQLLERIETQRLNVHVPY